MQQPASAGAHIQLLQRLRSGERPLRTVGILIGLAGGINTYSYASGAPPMFVDPSGLLEFKAQGATGSRVDRFSRPGQTGQTDGYVRVSKCECICRGNEWFLKECTASYSIHVQLLNDYPTSHMAGWAWRVELDHVYDLRAAIGAIRRAGETAENAAQPQGYSSKAACEISAAVAVLSAMDKALDDAYWETHNYWDYGRHTYTSPDRRP